MFSRLPVGGRAAGIQVIDGPFRDYDALRDYRQRIQGPRLRRQVGHPPDRAAVLNEVCSPTQELFEWAVARLDAYRGATDGAVVFDGAMINEASRKLALELVARGERAGLRR